MTDTAAKISALEWAIRAAHPASEHAAALRALLFDLRRKQAAVLVDTGRLSAALDKARTP